MGQRLLVTTSFGEPRGVIFVVFADSGVGAFGLEEESESAVGIVEVELGVVVHQGRLHQSSFSTLLIMVHLKSRSQANANSLVNI